MASKAEVKVFQSPYTAQEYSVNQFKDFTVGPFFLSQVTSIVGRGWIGKPKVTIEMFQDDSWIIDFKLKDTDAKAVNLHNLSTAYFSIKEDRWSSVYLLEKEEGNLGAIDEGHIIFIVDKSKTNIAPNSVNSPPYWYDVELVFVDGRAHTLCSGELKILYDVS